MLLYMKKTVLSKSLGNDNNNYFFEYANSIIINNFCVFTFFWFFKNLFIKNIKQCWHINNINIIKKVNK